MQGFNDVLAADPRIEALMLPLRDGLTIARRK
jgi:predicted O-methyltransferase YrrM